MDTIFALASAHGKAGVAVVRISGPDAFAVGTSLCGSLPVSREARVRQVRRASGEVLDEALVIAFPEGASFTGEPVVELHLHGSRAVVAAVLSELTVICRLAEPGEFTRRALDNNRLSLTEVEGLGDLIEAETEAQRIQARRLLTGELRKRVDGWRGQLVHVAALVEATIDFSDEELPDGVLEDAAMRLAPVFKEIADELSGAAQARSVREGFEVAIVGQPNVGKSTLLNAIANRDVAIVSDIAGTTRDVLEARVDLKGLQVTFLDTAGLRASSDTIEQIGIERAIERAESADLRIFLGDGAQDLGVCCEVEDLVVGAKGDVSGDGVSGKTGMGVSGLLTSVTDTLSGRAQSATLVSHNRQIESLSAAKFAFDRVLSALNTGSPDVEILSEDLMSGMRSLEILIGRVGIEDVYDDIFSSFCLGK